VSLCVVSSPPVSLQEEGAVFIQLYPVDRKWDEHDYAISRVASWFDQRGNRYLMVRSAGKDRYDFRIIVTGTVRVDKANVTYKQVVLAARTMGILLNQEQIERLTSNGVSAN